MPQLDLRAVPLEQTRPLRRDVLRPYMTVEELASHEPADAVAFGAFDGDELVAVGLVGPEGEPGDWRVRGMATAPAARGRGAGTRVLDALVRHATAHGATRLWCNARTPALSLYRRAGFEATSEEFQTPRIGPHYRMEYELAAPRRPRRVGFRRVSATSRVERVTTPDGDLDAYVTLPESGSGPGIVVLQEIFGVGGYIKEVTERLAGIGYVALAPDLYWRIKPGIAIEHTEEGMGEAFHTAQQLDHTLAVSDSIAALKALRELPEVTGGKAGVLGFCLGGTLAFEVAVRSDPDTAVCYYGAGIPGMRDNAEEIRCTILFHFGGQDPYIPREQAEDVCAFARTHSNMECHIHLDAGHAFDNHEAPMFHQPEPAAVAWGQTINFLARTLPA